MQLLLLLLGCIFVNAQITTWTGTTSRLWEDPLNWDNGVPNENISAAIRFSTIINSTSLAKAKSLELESGVTITFYNDVFIQNLTQNNASIIFKKRAVIDYYSLISNSVNIELHNNANVNVTTFFNWTGSNGFYGINATGFYLLPTCTSYISTTSGSIVNLPFSNFGNLIFSGYLSFNSRFQNQIGANFNISSGSAVNFAGTGEFINSGYIAASISTFFYCRFENKGIFDILNGNISFRQGSASNHSGTFNINSSANFIIFSGTHIFENASTILGNSIEIKGGIVNMFGSLSVSNISIYSAQVYFFREYSTFGTFQVLYQALAEIRQNWTISKLIVAGGQISMYGNNTVLTVSDSFTWTSDSSSGYINANTNFPGIVVLGPNCTTRASEFIILATTLYNYGNISFQSSNTAFISLFYPNGKIVNMPGANFSLTVNFNNSNFLLYQTGNFLALENYGFIYLSVTQSNFPIVFQFNFQNFGQIHLMRGTLRFSSPNLFLQYGKFVFYPGTQVIFQGFITFTNSSTIESNNISLRINGGNTTIFCDSYFKSLSIDSGNLYILSSNFSTESISLSGGTFYINTPIQIAPFSFTGGRLFIDYKGNITVLNNFTMAPFTDINTGLIGGGTLTLASTCQTILSGQQYFSVTWGNVTIQNFGNFSVNSVNVFVWTSTVFINQPSATLNLNSNTFSSSGYPMIFNNLGVINVTPLSPNFAFLSPISNNGIMNFRSGITSLHGSASHSGTFNIFSNAVLKISGGVINGSSLIIEEALNNTYPNFLGNLQLQKLIQYKGETTFNSTNINIQNLTLAGKIFKFSKNIIIPIFEFLDGNIYIFQRSQVQVTQYFHWTSVSSLLMSDLSSVSLNLASGCISDISGSGELYGIDVENMGEMNYHPDFGGIYLNAASVWTNRGHMIIENSIAVLGGFSIENFVNFGEISINSPGFIIESPFENHGNVTVFSGYLRIQSVLGTISHHSGNFYHFPNSSIEVLSGDHIFEVPGEFGPGDGIVFGGNVHIFNSFLPSNFIVTGGNTFFWIPYSTSMDIEVTFGRLYFNENVTMGTLINSGNFSVEKTWNVENIINSGIISLKVATLVLMTGNYNNINGSLERNGNSFLCPVFNYEIQNANCGRNGIINSSIIQNWFDIENLIWISPDGNFAGNDYVVFNCTPGVYSLGILELGASGCPTDHVTVFSFCQTTGEITTSLTTNQDVTTATTTDTFISTTAMATTSNAFISTSVVTTATNEESSSQESESRNESKTAIGIGVVAALILSASVIFLIIRNKKRRLDETEIKMQSMEMDESQKIPTLDSIVIQKKLGEGNFGEVYLGKWHDTPVALKKIRKDEELDNFKRELAMLMKAGANPNIVQVLGIFREKEDFYYVMEYIPNGNLSSLLHDKKSKLNLQDQMDIIISACKGMVFLEHKKIIHRDLAARNLLVVHSGKKYAVKIADFGLARSPQKSYYKAKSSNTIPVRWSAPELFRGIATTASDVWSFGVVMWEILEFGKVPFSWLSNKEITVKVPLGERLPKPANCPDDLWKIMNKCWEISPELRPTFSQLLIELKNFYENQFKEPSSAYNSFAEDDNETYQSHVEKRKKKRNSKKKNTYDKSPYGLDPVESEGKKEESNDEEVKLGYSQMKLVDDFRVAKEEKNPAYDSSIQVKAKPDQKEKKAIDETVQSDLKKQYQDLKKMESSSGSEENSSEGESYESTSEGSTEEDQENVNSSKAEISKNPYEEKLTVKESHYDKDVQVVNKDTGPPVYLYTANQK